MTAEKVAIVTAGGSGMGAGAARKLAEGGFRIAILSSSGKTEEIAAVIALLASEGGGYITGQNVRVDGGITRAV